MDYANHITDHEKGKHLTYEDYVAIELRLKDGWKPNAIAKKELHCAPNTVRNIIKKGMTPLYNGKVLRFKARTAWKAYQENRRHSCRTYEALEKRPFLQYVEKHFQEDQWSLDACVGRALKEGSFDRSEILCTKTLYNYVDFGLLNIKNIGQHRTIWQEHSAKDFASYESYKRAGILYVFPPFITARMRQKIGRRPQTQLCGDAIDLPQKLSRNTKIHKDKENKRVLGRSIEERPKEVDTREDFGHWETDLVIGQKSGKDEVLLTLLERKTRDFSIMRLPDKSADSVLGAFQKMQSELGDYFSKVFRTITTDNGSEFARLSELETGTSTKVYFTHPYTSCEKGSIENHNGLIRRFIPKGKRISDYGEDDILAVELWANSLPRKVLGYKTPDEAFEAEMDKIFAA